MPGWTADHIGGGARCWRCDRGFRVNDALAWAGWALRIGVQWLSQLVFSILWFMAPFLMIDAHQTNQDPVCGGVPGMDRAAGESFLLALAFGVAGPALAAAISALTRQWRVALVWLGLGVATFGVMAAVEAFTVDKFREAIRVVQHPPAPQPDPDPSRQEWCDRLRPRAASRVS